MKKVLTDNSATNDEVEALAHAHQNEKMEYEAKKEEELWEQELERKLWEEQLQSEWQYKQEHMIVKVVHA